MNPLHDQLLREYTQQVAALLDGFLGTAAAFGVLASKHPESNARYNAGGEFCAAAKSLYRHVEEHRMFGFPPLGTLDVASEEVQNLIGLALRFGEAYTRALTEYDAGEGDMPDRFTATFEVADMKASEANRELEQAAIDSFEVPA